MTDTKLLIVADDLTGGLDTGVQFARQGIKVRVVVDPDPAGDWTRNAAQVLVAVSESRHMMPEDAYETVYRIISAGRQAGIPYFYKKTDSALRGNIGAELDAALKASGAEVLSFLPAYPAMNRITTKGCHYIDGVPVAESVFGSDPFNPVVESDVRKLVASQTDTQVTSDGRCGKGILVVDAQSDEDLREAGARLSKYGRLSVSAGCAGFAAFLPDLLGLQRGETPDSFDLGESLLVLSGSLNPVTMRQIEYAQNNGFKRICPRPEQNSRPEILAAKLPLKEKWLILDSGGIDPEEKSFRNYMRSKGMDSEEARERIAAYLAEILAELEDPCVNSCDDSCEGSVMIIGGDTLLACLRRLGCKDLEPLAELFPGVVLSRYRSGEKEKLLISKSGGFGSETLLADLREMMEINGRRKEMEQMQNNKPIIAITMGDPASIGPEISAKVLAEKETYEICRPLLVGDVCMMEKALKITGPPNLQINAVSSPAEAKYQFGTIDVLDMGLVNAETLPVGQVSKEAGEAAFRYVEKVIALAMAGEADGTVTNALNKEAVNLAGHHFAGHTEIYAHYTNTQKYTMMLAHGNLRVVHVSTHVSLREACDRVKKDRVLEVIRIAWQACRDLGIEKPRVGVAGLNPHSGEHGLFGREEIDEIIPAIEAAQAEGIDADGPVPPDTVFSKARGGWYDIVVAMYHDQGHIPLKLIGFVYDHEAGSWQSVEGVNITLGLPIIRVSVDHGTAFDQAGKGSADQASLRNAIDYAVRLASARKK